MNEEIATKVLLNNIIKAAQEKKAKNITIIDMTDMPGAICRYFVICSGNVPTQVEAIADEIEDYVRRNIKEKPLSVDGLSEARWVGMDYGTVIVHIFIPELREFYDLEHLWADAPVEILPDVE